MKLSEFWMFAVALFLLTVSGLVSVYQTLFALWMTSYPKVNHAACATRFYTRAGITAALLACWMGTLVGMFALLKLNQRFRYNNLKDKKDVDRFTLALTQVYGRRLTYREVAGKA